MLVVTIESETDAFTWLEITFATTVPFTAAVPAPETLTAVVRGTKAVELNSSPERVPAFFSSSEELLFIFFAESDFCFIKDNKFAVLSGLLYLFSAFTSTFVALIL